MGRWEPGAYGRLQQAALDLFSEQGFEGTTVTQIAARAGLTKRTYFHYFVDKREVLFPGSEDVEKLVMSEIRAQPETVPPLHAATAGLKTAASTVFEQRREDATRRSQIIAASPELRERDMLKRAVLTDTIAAALQDRGTAEQPAVLVASSAVAVFYAAFARWIQPTNDQPLVRLIDEALEELLKATPPAPPSSH